MGLEVTWDGGDGGEGAACLEIPLARLEVSSPPGSLWLGGMREKVGQGRVFVVRMGRGEAEMKKVR